MFNQEKRSASPSKPSDHSESSPKMQSPYLDFSKYIQGTTDEILNLLDGVEKELNSRKRVRNLSLHRTASKLQQCRDNISNITMHGTDFTSRHWSNDRADHSYGEAQDSRKIYQNTNEGSSGRQSLPSIGDRQQQPSLKGILRKSKSADRNKTDDLISYVDHNLSNPEVKWHKGMPNLLPKHASRIGYTKTGKPLYAARAWDDLRSFLIPTYLDVDEGQCYFGKDGRLWTSTNYEVMECSHIAWDDAKGTPVTELPHFAFKAGYNEKDKPLYFGRAFIDGAITPGYIEEKFVEGAPNNRAFALVIPFRNNILRIFDTYEVMVVIPFKNIRY